MELHNAMYKISEVVGKGLGWIALRDIKKGEKVWEENAIIDNLGKNVGGRRLLIVPELDRIVAQLSPENKKHFLSLNDPDKNGDPAFRNNRIYQNNVLSDGLFVMISRLNHSCQPNVIWSSDDDFPPFLEEVRALRNIPAGEEITTCYFRASEMKIKVDRQELVKNWGFDCNCPVCSLSGADLVKNEESRKIVSDSKQKISNFLDSMQVMMPGRERFYSLNVKALYKLASASLKLLETDLVLDAGSVIVSNLHNMAVLSAFAQSLRLRIPGCEKPEAYRARAWQEAGQMGKMFLYECEQMDLELEMIKTIPFSV